MSHDTQINKVCVLVRLSYFVLYLDFIGHISYNWSEWQDLDLFLVFLFGLVWVGLVWCDLLTKIFGYYY